MTLRFASGEFYGRDEIRRDHAGFGFASLTAAGREDDVETHTHDTAHFVLVLGGGYISSAKGAPEVACAPALVFNPAGVKHRDRFLNGVGRFLTLTVSSATEAEARDGEAPLDGEAVALPDPSAVRAARTLERALRKPEPQALVLESAAWQLIGSAAGACPDPSPPPWLKTAQAMIRETTDRVLSVGEIAGQVGVHPVHLARAFGQWFGCSPGEYLRGRRLERAAALVGRGASALADVAAETGFTDQAHLTHAFRTAFGATPGAWRNGRVACVQAGTSAAA